MVMHGADTDQLRTLAARLEQSGNALDSISTALTRSVLSAKWDGDDGVRFSTEWTRRHKPCLIAMSVRLCNVGAQVRREALAQDLASGRVDWSPYVGGGRNLSGLGTGGQPVDGRISSMSNLLESLGSLVGAMDLDGAIADRVGGASVMLGGTALGLALIGTALKPGAAATAVEGVATLADIGSRSFNAVRAVQRYAEPVSKLGKAGGVLGVVGGLAGLYGDLQSVQSEGWTLVNSLSTAGNGLTVVGSALILVPIPPVPAIGAVVAGVGGVFHGGSWVAENWDTAVSPALRSAADTFGAAVDGIGDGMSESLGVLEDGARSINNAVAGSVSQIRGLFS